MESRTCGTRTGFPTRVGCVNRNDDARLVNETHRAVSRLGLTYPTPRWQKPAEHLVLHQTLIDRLGGRGWTERKGTKPRADEKVMVLGKLARVAAFKGVAPVAPSPPGKTTRNRVPRSRMVAVVFRGGVGRGVGAKHIVRLPAMRQL